LTAGKTISDANTADLNAANIIYAYAIISPTAGGSATVVISNRLRSEVPHYAVGWCVNTANSVNNTNSVAYANWT